MGIDFRVFPRYFCADPTKHEPCPGGTFQREWGATSCDSCPAGYSGLAVGQVDDADCAACFAGTYGAPGGCTPCEPGFFAADDVAAECAPCPASTYSPDPGMTECFPCPVGKACPEGTSTPVQCSLGEPTAELLAAQGRDRDTIPNQGSLNMQQSCRGSFLAVSMPILASKSSIFI